MVDDTGPRGEGERVLTPAAYERYGPCLVYGLGYCDPDAVVATADAIRATRARRT